MTSEATLRLVLSAPGSEAQLKYVKPSVERFGSFRELAKNDDETDPGSAFAGRRRSVAFLGLLSPDTPKPDGEIKV